VTHLHGKKKMVKKVAIVKKINANRIIVCASRMISNVVSIVNATNHNAKITIIMINMIKLIIFKMSK
jgi:hypothetical protein